MSETLYPTFIKILKEYLCFNYKLETDSLYLHIPTTSAK